VLAVFVVGCGPNVEYAEVQGIVTLEGRPLPGVKVAFYPDDEGKEQLPYATGVTDAAGVYTLTAVTNQPGAMVGKHRVVINWPPPERSDDRNKPRPRPGPPIPIRYTVADQTRLIVEVKAGPRQTIDLPLTR
jgi:hypothetical protein